MVIGDVLTPGWGSKEGLPRMKDEEKKQPIWNVYGKIEGIEQSEKTIMVGNHRDAWAFGATDPHTGTAIMMEVARLFGILLLKGWRPLRTIEFMSWDGEAYNMIGSTNFELHASGSPVFQSVLKRILERIEDPHHNMTLRELWDKRGGKIEEPSVRGDSVPFLDIAGTSTLDLSFRGDPHPQYSSYDNFDWMKRIGDPGFVYHGLMAQVVAFLCLELADRPIMPFDMEAYGVKLDKWAEELTECVVMGGGGWESSGMNTKRIEYNTRMAGFETALLDIEQGGGIPNRTQFKHVVFGPQAWSHTKQVTFPAIRDAIEDANWELAHKLVEKTSVLIRNAAKVLLDQQADEVPGR
ncbi:hypothetical protein BJF96_g9898 [Verticillium dahliae]|uniref:Glutamate carboxypeptidase n=1 Tax=Verticillium dahliae TaxID=27337 RepID=A0AA45AHG4_VERDA|nr:hypothetical protein BJF96_g9898 [Verticillium dahliae]